MKGNSRRYLLLVIAVLATALIVLCVSSRRRYSSEEIVVTRLESVTEASVTKPSVTKQEKAPETQSEPSAVTENCTDIASSELIVDVSTATAEELCQLEGIGPVKAAAIIAYREENGGFTGAEDLLNVDGIGPETYQAIVENITVSLVKMTTVTVTEKVTTEPVTVSDDASEPSTEHILTLEEVAPIDLNKATKEELMLLPGVDEETAEAILRLREGIHGFSHVYELLYVDELTQKQVAEMAEFVTIGE